MASILDNPLQKLTKGIFQSGFAVNDTVTMKILGKSFNGFDSIAISKSMDSLATSFTINVADKWRQTKEKYPIMPGQSAAVYLGQIGVIDGYIEQFSASVSNDDRNIAISGTGKVADVIDSAAIGLRAVYKNITLKELAEEYVGAFRFNIKIKDISASATKRFKRVTINQGETILELLSRYAKQNGVLLTSDNESNILITDAFARNFDISVAGPSNLVGPPLGPEVQARIGLSPTGLFQGKNVLFASSSFDETSRFQKYLVKSQIPGDDHVNAGDTTSINAVATDKEVLRLRTKYIIAEKSMTNSEAKDRATWEATSAAAQAASAQVTVQGWRNQAGEMWDTNYLVETDLRFIGFAKGQYLISGVTFMQDKSKGTTTTLTLSRADAYNNVEPEIKADPKKGAGWDNSIFGTELKQLSKNLGF